MLSDRQKAVIDFIGEQHSATGFMPTTREIQRHFGYASQTSVQDILTALERKGALQRQPGKARALTLKGPFEKMEYAGMGGRSIVDIPIYGMIPAGMPVDLEQQADGCVSIDLENLRLSNGTKVFALKVRGDSMINAGILDGDTVILQYKEPRDRDIVAALIDGETTLKRYITHCGRPWLKAENPLYPDLIPARELIIQGVQVALLRTN